MKTPWHIWLVGGATLVFNLGGVVDYVMTQTDNAAYMAQFSDMERAYFEEFPTWVVASWALAVWSAFAGSALLLLRRRLAAQAFGLALGAMGLTMLHNFGLAELKMHHVVGQGAIVFSAVIAGVTVASFLYARAMAARGHLR